MMGSTQVVQGATTTIVTPNVYPTITSGQATSAWSAVGNLSTGAIAQVGFAFEPGVASIDPHYFFGYIPTGGSYHEVDSNVGPARGSSHSYTVKKSSGYWVGIVDSSTISSTAANVSPDCVQYLNENDSSSTRYMGTSTDKLLMSGAQYWDGSASASESTSWVWKKPLLNFTNSTYSAIDKSSWSSSGYWFSWDTH